MAQLNAFHAHILEACAQRDLTEPEALRQVKAMGYDVVIVNNNPETVSTDFDVSDRLYFEPLTKEDVWGVIEAENPIGVVVAFGGQTAIKLAKFLDAKGIRILGTSAEGIDTAEDRERFDRLLSKFRIKRPKGLGVKTLEQALRAAESIGYPVLLRPSYVIGGQNMTIAYGENDVRAYMDIILSQGIGDTIRVSLTGDPKEEIKSAKLILRTLGLRKGGIEVVSCPTCGRTQIDLITLANQVEKLVAQYDLDLRIAVMGCVVNGPGEAREADLGVAGGCGEGLLFKKGKILRKMPEDQLLAALKDELDHWEEERI